MPRHPRRKLFGRARRVSFFRRLWHETLEKRNLLSGLWYHNPVNPYDVDVDGKANGRDAWYLNEALKLGERVLLEPNGPVPYFVDVSGDGKLSLLDNELLVRFLTNTLDQLVDDELLSLLASDQTADAALLDSGGTMTTMSCPSVTLNSVSGVNEGSAFSVPGVVSPPGMYFIQGSVDWGNSPGDTGMGSFGTNPDGTFSMPHIYFDDGPAPGNGTPQDTETVSLTATINGCPVSANTTVTINNTNPVPQLTLTNSNQPLGGPRWEISGTIQDASMSDVHTVTIHWGDGSTPTVVNNLPTNTQFTVEHEYDPRQIHEGPLPYYVTASVVDDDTGSASWGPIEVPQYVLDLDNDANNDDLIEPPDDPIEHIAPGRYLLVNSDDDNENGIPDMDEEGPIAEEDDLEPLEIGWAPRTGFDYTGWHLVLTIDPEPSLDQYGNYVGVAKFYMSPDKTGFLSFEQTAEGPGFDWVIGTDTIPTVLFVEAVASPLLISLQLSLLTPSGFHTDEDVVVFTPIDFGVDIDVDSNNDGVIDAIDDPIEMENPGAIVGINDNDDNENGMADSLEVPTGAFIDPDLTRVNLSYWLTNQSNNLADWELRLSSDAASTDIAVWQEDPLDPSGPMIQIPVTGNGYAWNLLTNPPPDHVWLEGLQPAQEILQLVLQQNSTQRKHTDKAKAVNPRVNVVYLSTYLDNRPLDENPPIFGDDNGYDPGLRIFAEKKSYTDAFAGRRNKVLVEVTVVPFGISGIPVVMQWWDIDDPTSTTEPLDLTPDGAAGPIGGDNLYDPRFTALWPGTTGDEGAAKSVTVKTVSGVARARLSVSAQPANNYQVTATAKPRVNGELTQAHIDGREEFKHAPDVKASRPLTVWRTLHVEQDSFAAPEGEVFNADGDGPAGVPDPAVDWDINPHDIGDGNPDETFRTPSLEFAKREFRKTMVEVEVVPIADDPRDDAPFVRELGELLWKDSCQVVSDVESSKYYWAGQLCAAYEVLFKDYDFPGAVQNVIMGMTTAGGVIDPQGSTAKLTSAILLETIRDVALNAPSPLPGTTKAKQPEASIIERTVFHELLHLFGMAHADMPPLNEWEEGVMIPNNVIYGTDEENELTDSQAAEIRKQERP